MKKHYILVTLVVPFLSIASDSTDSTSFTAEIYNISVNNNNGKVILDNPLVRSDVSPWTNWTLINEPTNCDPWMPEPSTVNMNQAFSQTAECDDNEIRTQTTTNYYADGQVVEIIDSEYNEVLVNIAQNAVGSKNYIVTTESEYGNWIDVGVHYSCSSWTPKTSTINSGVKFTQKRNCKQKQKQKVKAYNVWSNGAKTLASESDKTQEISEVVSRQETGTKSSYDCRYSTSGGNNNNFWMELWGGGYYAIWQGEFILDYSKLFKKGKHVTSNESGRLYEVCKAPN